MSDELRQLATAISALAESNQGIGGVLREEVASRFETNRILAGIFDQNASILEAIERANARHLESEKEIRVIKSVTRAHDKRIETLEGLAGSRQPSSQADLERAIESAGDARDIAQDMLRRLPDYDGSEEEDTARVNVSSIHVHMHSEPDHERESALPELPKKGPWRWLGLLVGTIVAAVLTWFSGRIGK